MRSKDPIIAVYPGSFDPVTLGHEDIARRTLKFCDRLIVAVSEHASQSKRGAFEVSERLELLEAVFETQNRIECASFGGLLVDYAKARDARFIIRGLRAVSDFEYEFQMAQMNCELWDRCETLFLAPDARYSFLSASLVREVASLGGDVRSFVSPAVWEALLARYRTSPERR